MNTQNRQILAHLQSGKRLTGLDALSLFGCFRLGARIYDLKQDGHAINSRSISTENGKRVSEYWIGE